MSPLKRNIAASYASQFFTAGLGLVMLPIYVRYMGLEAYGLVGAFLMLQSWLTLLDFGLSATMMREAARSRAGAISTADLRQQLFVFEVILSTVGLAVAIALVANASWLARHWLNVEQLSPGVIHDAIFLMAPALALRFVSSLYRSLITGFEELVWLGGFNACVAALRFVLVLPAFELFGPTPHIFFLVQLAVAAAEFAILALRSHSRRYFPDAKRPKLDFGALRGMIGFSLSAAFAGIIWVIVTQIDKLLLSAILPLSDYGIISLVTLAANGILLVSAPISGSLAPRLMALRGQGDETSYVTTYRRATQFTAATVIPVAITLALFSAETLRAWTGDARIVEGGAQALALYAAGTGLLTLSAFPAYLQYAAGQLKLQVLGSLLFLLAIAPLIVWLATRYGAVGAGAAWLTVNIAYFLAWVPVVHQRFLPKLHWAWLTRDVGAIVLPAVAVALLLRLALPFPESRLLTAFELGLAGLAVLFAAAAGSDWIRGRASELLANGWRRQWN